MGQGISRARQRGRGVVATILLALVLGGALIGGLYWWSSRPAAQSAAPAAPTPATADAAPAITPAEAAPRAEAALRDQRMFAPPRDNAFELYLQVAAAQPDNVQARNAINDLFPYALLYIEERIAAGDVADVERMYGLMQRADADAPALPRLAAALDTLRSEEAQRQADADAAAARAQAVAAVAASAPVAAAPAPTPATNTPPPASAAPTRATPAPQATASTSPPAAAPAPVAAAPVAATTDQAVTPSSELPPVLQSPQARYPVIAMRRKLEGRVELAFTVLPDGSVSNVEVVQSEPDGVFDREAVSAMERWRFAPPQAQVRGRRVFDFRLD